MAILVLDAVQLDMDARGIVGVQLKKALHQL
jgi:hypothetical protein